MARQSKTRRDYHHGDAREALLDVAAELVVEHGSAGFSLREAARRVGIDPAACYRHFRDRNEILQGLARRGFVLLASRMHEVDADDTQQRLQALGRVYVDFAVEQAAHFRLMFGESGVPSRSPVLRDPTVEGTPFELLGEAIADWQAAHGLEEPVEELAIALWGTVHGIARLVVDGAIELDEPGRREVVDRAVYSMLSGWENGHPA